MSVALLVHDLLQVEYNLYRIIRCAGRKRWGSPLQPIPMQAHGDARSHFIANGSKKKTRTKLSIVICKGCRADKIEKYMRNKKFRKKSIKLYKLEIPNPKSLVFISCQS